MPRPSRVELTKPGRVCLALVPCQGRQIDPERILQQLDAAGLATYAMPEFILTVPELPSTASGKVLKRELLRWVQEGRVQPVPVRFRSPAARG